MIKIKGLRWWLCGLLFIATSLSFLDRQVLSTLAPTITEEFQMSNTAYSYVASAFIVSYAIFFFLGGRLIDWLGTRVGMLISVGFWSIASAAHGIVQGPLQLGIARFLLGVGEGGCFPGAAKGATEWFPHKERSTAIGIAIGGAALGAVIAPPLTIWLKNWIGWRGVFYATGMIGGAWVLLWWIFYNKPKKSSFLTEEELTYIEQDLEEELKNTPSQKENEKILPLKKIMKLKQTWGIGLIRFLIDWVFYFYMFWIPKYLFQERGIPEDRIGKELLWIPFLALGISNIIGGWLSDKLVKKGVPVNKARKSIMTAAAILTIFSLFTPYAPSAEVAVAFMTLLMFAHGFFITNWVTIISDIFPQTSVGTIMGIGGTLGAIGGILASPVIGYVADNFSFMPIWIASGMMYPLAIVVLYVMIGPIRKLQIS